MKPGDIVQMTIATGGWGYKIGDRVVGVVQQINLKPPRVEVSFRTARKSSVKRWFLPDTWRKML